VQGQLLRQDGFLDRTGRFSRSGIFSAWA